MDTIKWPSEQCALVFPWINDTCRQTPTYSRASPQHTLALRRPPCSTLLRRIGVLYLVCLSHFRTTSRTLKALRWRSKWLTKWILRFFKQILPWNVLRDEGEVLLLYLQSHIRDRTWNPIYLTRYGLHIGNSRWDLASAWCSWAITHASVTVSLWHPPSLISSSLSGMWDVWATSMCNKWTQK